MEIENPVKNVIQVVENVLAQIQLNVWIVLMWVILYQMVNVFKKVNVLLEVGWMEMNVNHAFHIVAVAQLILHVQHAHPDSL